MSSFDRLSFTRTRPRSEWAGTGLLPRCFWHVRPTGNYGEDNRTGVRLALEYLEYQAANRSAPCLLGNIVGDFPSELSGIEVAFLEVIGFAAAQGIGEARRIANYWHSQGEAA